ncbi:hypothetical protein NW762_004665 [Fusarium torreyae]|uniref:Uncharacterized protein n=1 Tax=Fusarium torreyae TaxID=1237075 RepID=A0A9W8S3Y4_9HYPO|nr:hypothetical protein NW762_004665 [Fusarium torreyae]
MNTPRASRVATSAISDTLTLTPVRPRRTRPSFSPLKSQTPKGSIPKSNSASLADPQPSKPELNYHLPTAALEFKEFSFWGEDGSLSRNNVSSDQREALENYLFETYQVVVCFYSDPFLVLGCEGDLPPEDERPFTIAGLVAIWRDSDNVIISRYLGSLGQGPLINIDTEILELIQPGKFIPDKAALYLAEYIFPTCEAIAKIWSDLIIELPKMSDDKFQNDLETLPEEIDGFAFNIFYHNGPLPNTQRRRRAVTPNTRDLEGACDETDYVELVGKFYPGAMINSMDKAGNVVSSATAGILVEKENERRLTCSFHNWQRHFDTHPEQFGLSDLESRATFRVVQGQNPGTNVGFVTERIGETDIALAKLDDNDTFDNQFMEMECAPKVLLHSKNVKDGDKFIIDSFTTGKQVLLSIGCRIAFRRRPRGQPTHDIILPKAKEHLCPSPHLPYIVSKQGVYATDAVGMSKKPFIRDGVCGAVLLRASKRGGNEAQAVGIQRGEIGGMMHFADVQLKHMNDASSFFVYADVFDPLIEQGWTVVQQPEALPQQVQSTNGSRKRPEDKTESNDDQDDEESPSKKQRV